MMTNTIGKEPINVFQRSCNRYAHLGRSRRRPPARSTGWINNTRWRTQHAAVQPAGEPHNPYLHRPPAATHGRLQPRQPHRAVGASAACGGNRAGIRAGFRIFIAGGALGFDYWAACTVLDHQQRLILALPFAGHDRRWNDQSRKELAALINRTHAAGGEVRYISAPGYSPQKMMRRDHWMVDRAQAVIAGWDGGQQGGTWNAIT